jgi:hypothetical protein
LCIANIAFGQKPLTVAQDLVRGESLISSAFWNSPCTGFSNPPATPGTRAEKPIKIQEEYFAIAGEAR